MSNVPDFSMENLSLADFHDRVMVSEVVPPDADPFSTSSSQRGHY